MDLRDVYYQKADAQLREWQVWIEQVKRRSEAQPVKRADDHLRALERLEDRFRLARDRLDRLRLSSAARWDSAKQAVELAMIDLKQALDQCGAGEIGKSVMLKADRSHIVEPFFHQRG